jgi:uncharacterized protein YjdB
MPAPSPIQESPVIERIRRAGTLLLVLIVSACESPAKPIPVSAVVVTPADASVIVGTPQQLTAITRDAQGTTLTGRSVAWTSLSGTIASVSSTGLVTTLSPGVATIQATSEGVVGSTSITVRPVPVAAVVVTPSSATLIAGTSQQLTVVTRDAQGGLLTERVSLFSSNNPAVAAVSSAGLVTTLTPGTADITVTSEGIVATVPITVLPVPVATVLVTLPAGALTVGATQQASAVTRDANGGTLTGRPITWRTSDPSIATVGATGLVQAVAPGTVAVIAESEGQSGSAALTVQSAAVAITGITPATLVPGASATLTVSGFNPTAGATTVTVQGVPAPIVSSTGTQVVVGVPCVPSGAAVVRVANGAISPVTRTHPVQAPQRTVPLGQALILTSSSESFCNELVATGGPARFLVTVFSVATSQNTLAAFELAGNPAAAGSAPIVRPVVTAASPIEVAPAESNTVDATIRRHEREHFAMLERNRRDYERLRVLAPPASRVASNTARREVAAEVTPGDMRDVFFTFSGGCNDVSRIIRAKAIRVGSRSIIWEDSANTLQSADNADLAGYYARIGQIYDQEQHASIVQSFGDPLVRDAVTDNDGKVHMVFSQRLNTTGAAAYVTSCDQFPTSSAPGSNFGQYFYGFVPTNATLNVNSTGSPDGWFYFMARTIIHEVKHIASMSARVANNAPSFEQSWLEEGTARHAEEMWVRESLHRVPWKGNTGFGTAATNGIYCDFHPADATCNAADGLRRPGYGMRRQFNEIRDKLLQPWNWSPFGDGTGQSGAVFYNTTWSLVRYAADRYGTNDAAFLRALNNSNATGVANLTAVAGVSLDRLIGGWGLALFADDYPGLTAPSPDIQFPTWNLRSIYAGLNAAPAWTVRWNSPFPIQPTSVPFGAFVVPVPLIRGGAHAYLELSGTFTTPQLLHLRTSETTAPSTALRIAITRLQ